MDIEPELKLTPPLFAVLLRDATGSLLLRGAERIWLPLFTNGSKAREFLSTPGLSECLIYRVDNIEHLSTYLENPPSRSPIGAQFDFVVIDPDSQRQSEGLVAEGLTGYRPEQFHLPVATSDILLRDRFKDDPLLIRTARKMVDRIAMDVELRADVYFVADQPRLADLPRIVDTPLSFDWAEDLNERQVYILRMTHPDSVAYAQVALTRAEMSSEVHLRVRVFQLRSILFRYGIESLRRDPVGTRG